MGLVWGNVKARELANLCPDHIAEAHTAAETGLRRVGRNYNLCFNFLDHTGLPLTRKLPQLVPVRTHM